MAVSTARIDRSMKNFPGRRQSFEVSSTQRAYHQLLDTYILPKLREGDFRVVGDFWTVGQFRTCYFMALIFAPLAILPIHVKYPTFELSGVLRMLAKTPA